MIVKLTEQQYRFFSNARDVLGEDVYAKGIDNDNKTINLTYTKGGSSRRRNKYGGEFVKTDKMDRLDNDTYIVPLKGGIKSYNITSIGGSKVMRYFKHYFERGGNTGDKVKVAGEDYTLQLEEKEFNDFLNMFIAKVGAVIEHYARNMIYENNAVDFTRLAIYPVKSSSNFNTTIVDELIRRGVTINGMTLERVSEEILQKDTTELQKDEDFINKNKDYYNSKRAWNGSDNLKGTHMQALNTDYNRLSRLPEVQAQIDKANEYTFSQHRASRGKLLRQWDSVKNRLKNGKPIDKSIALLDQYLREYQEAVDQITKIAAYYDETVGKADKKIKPHLEKVAQKIKNTKGPTVLKRKEELLALLRQYGYGKNLPNPLYDICMWRPVDFQVKKLGNDSRLAMKNFFKFDDDILQQEMDRIKNSILVIFDDNISGGSTLSDICYQYSKLGIEHIIPITFGKMHEQWVMNGTVIDKPENGFNF